MKLYKIIIEIYQNSVLKWKKSTENNSYQSLKERWCINSLKETDEKIKIKEINNAKIISEWGFI